MKHFLGSPILFLALVFVLAVLSISGRVMASYSPVGTFDSVNNSICQVSGWAKDPDTTSPVQVHIYKDGPYPQGTVVATIIADLFRSDLPYTDKNHGFVFGFPKESGLYDDQEHLIYIYGIDATGDANVLLSSNPKTIICSQLKTFANVKAFGANGDGLADDAPAIQQAIDSLLPSGGIVYIPAGTYMLGTSAGGVEHFPNGNPIQSALIIRNENVTLRGDGSLTILKLMAHKKMRILSVTSKNVTLENFIADGNKAQRDGSLPWPNADVVDGLVYASSASRNVVVRNCEVRNGIEDGIGFWKSDDARVENCFSHDHGTPQAGASGISLSGGARGQAINSVSVNNTIGIWSAFGSKDVEITGNTVKNNAQEGIIIGGFTIENGKGDNSGFVIKNNHVEGNGGNGFASISIASASNGRIVGNIIVNNYYDGVQLSDDGITPSQDWTIENNTCSNTNYLRLQDFGVRILDKSNIITLRKNTCENNGKSIDDQIVLSNPSAVNSDWRYLNTMSYTPLCADECTSGQKRCSGSYTQTCGNYDNDSCLEWNAGTYCQFGCSNGDCNVSSTGNADLNSDGEVDIYDLVLVISKFGSTSGFDLSLDVFPDGEIDIYDVVFVASRFS